MWAPHSPSIPTTGGGSQGSGRRGGSPPPPPDSRGIRIGPPPPLAWIPGRAGPSARAMRTLNAGQTSHSLPHRLHNAGRGVDRGNTFFRKKMPQQNRSDNLQIASSIGTSRFQLIGARFKIKNKSAKTFRARKNSTYYQQNVTRWVEFS